MAGKSPRSELVEKLEALGVEHITIPGRDDGFAGLNYNGKSFAHFHSDHELDLRLTRAVIEREGLRHPKPSLVHPKRSEKSPWIEVRFATSTEVDDVVRLVQLAITKL